MKDKHIKRNLSILTVLIILMVTLLMMSCTPYLYDKDWKVIDVDKEYIYLESGNMTHKLRNIDGVDKSRIGDSLICRDEFKNQ